MFPVHVFVMVGINSVKFYLLWSHRFDSYHAIASALVMTVDWTLTS